MYLSELSSEEFLLVDDYFLMISLSLSFEWYNIITTSLSYNQSNW